MQLGAKVYCFPCKSHRDKYPSKMSFSMVGMSYRYIDIEI